MPVQHRHKHRDAVRVHAVDGAARCGQHRFRHERLHLHRQRTVAVERERDARAFDGRVGGREEQAGRIGHLFDADAAHVEAAHFVSGAEPVLHRAQHAQRGLRVTLELAHHIHQMLKRARAGDRTVLGHMAHQQHRHVERFGRVDQRARHLAHLRGAARNAIHVLRDDRLRRIDDRQGRLVLLNQAERGRQIGRGGEQQVLFDRADARGAQPHLRLRFLTGNIEHGVALRGATARFGDVARGLEQ